MKNIKRLLIFIISLFAVFAFSFANVYAEGEGEGGEGGQTDPVDPPQPTASITVSPTSAELEVDETVTLTHEVSGVDDVYSVDWSSSDESVATVSNNGVVTAKKAGTATITVKINSTDVSATCDITVKEKETAADYKLVVEGGTLDKKFDKDVFEYTVNVTDLSNLDIDVEPETAKKSIPNYSNVKNGSTITVTIEGKQYKLTFSVPDANTYLSSLKITGQSFNQTFDKDTVSYTLTVPYEINEIEIVATADDPNATVKGTGYKDLSVGSTTFTITVTNGSSTRTYKIFVTREDDEDTDTTGTKKKTKRIVTNKNTSNQAEFDIPDVDDPDSTLNMIIITLTSLVLFAAGIFGIYFYIKTSPRKLKKEILKNKKKNNESPIVEISSPSNNIDDDIV